MLAQSKSTEKDTAIIDTECDTTLNDIRKIFHNKYYDLVIERTTEILKDLREQQPETTMLQQKIANILELRMMAWEAKLCYMNALADAQEIIKYAPHGTKGYLWTGQLYARLHKHEQGIEILEKGLEQVILSSSNEHYYQKLKEAIQMLEKQHDQKKDILTSLPFELSSRILDQLCQRTLVQCSNVNSSWRTLVTKYPKIWRHVDIPEFEVNDMYLPFYKLFPFITHHIQELEVHDINGLEKCLDSLRRNNFENLSTFRMCLRPRIPSGLDSDYGDIYSSFTNVSDTLTSLDLDFSNVAGLHLAHILSILRNLTSLRLYATWDNSNEGILGAFKIPFTTQLTTLNLRYRTNAHTYKVAFTVHEIQQLVRSSPHLRLLSLSSCPEQIYDEVAQHCPNIQQLIINAWYVPFMTINDQSYGLKMLVAAEIHSGTALGSLLTRHASSLKILDLNQEELSLDLIGTLGIFSTVNFSNLVNIVMCTVDPEISDQLPRMVQETSQLEVLSLQDIDGVVPDSVFETLVVKFPNFKKLTLHSCDFSDTALSNCLHSFATGSARSSSLEILDIYPIKGYTNDAVLESCARIKSLTRLSIFHSRAGQTAAESFAKDVAKLPRLEKLNIYNLPMTGKDIQRIGQNSSIRNVYFGFSKGITKEQARSAFSHDVSLRFEYAFDESDSDFDFDSYYIENDNDNDFYGGT